MEDRRTLFDREALTHLAELLRVWRRCSCTAAREARCPPTDSRLTIAGFDRPLYTGRFDGFETEAYQAPEHQLLVIADLPRADVEDLASWLVSPAERFVASLPTTAGMPQER